MKKYKICYKESQSLNQQGDWKFAKIEKVEYMFKIYKNLRLILMN